MKLLKPLTRETINNLKKGFQLDVSGYKNLPIIPEDFTGTLDKLYKSGYISIKRLHSDSKSLWWISVTTSGVDFIKQFEVEKYSTIVN